MQHPIAIDLDRLIKKASAKKDAIVKKAADVSAKLENMDDKTSPAVTGEQAAANEAAAKEHYSGGNTVDTGAKDSQTGASVAKSTDGAVAASTDGQAGGKGADSEVVKEADNGTPESLKSAAALRKMAGELRKAASAAIDPLGQFLVKAARSNENPNVKRAAEQMPDDQLADQAGDAIMQQIQSGQMSEEDAIKVLEEAMASGAISEEDVKQALAEMQGGAAPADAAVPPEAAGAMPPAAPEGELPPEMAQKLAAAEIGPDHPDYMRKIASLYGEQQQAGYAFGQHLAELLIKQAEESEKKEEPEEKEEKKEESKEPSDAEKEAMAAVEAELGLNSKQASALLALDTGTPDQMTAFKNQYRAALANKLAAAAK